MHWIKKLFEHYRSYHQHGPLLLRQVSLLGVIGFPLFYLLRFGKTAPVYDDLWLRSLNAAAWLLVFLRDRWPERLKPYYIGFTYAVLIVSLPFTLVFTSLKHGGGPIAVANTFMAVFFLLLLADWRNMIVMLLAGFGLGVLFYVTTDPAPKMPVGYVERLPVLIISIIGGSLFKFALLRGTAEQVRQAYGSLAGSIAHEMRNPLIQVKHHLESMQQALPMPTTHQAQPQEKEDGLVVDELYRHVAQGELAVSRGLQVIAMTLDEVSAKPLDPAAFSFLSAAEAADKAVREYGYASDDQRRRVRIEVLDDFTFRGDETAFVFVLFNLLKNALYYLPVRPGLEVVITVAAHEVRVRDTGPGMPADVLAHVFEPFRTVGKAGGTGLGLAYCQRVVRSFGGEIACRSVEGTYTEFTIGLPAVPAADLQAHELCLREEAISTFAGRSILVVDDDDGARESTRNKLQGLCATVDTVPGASQALAFLARSRYDLLVLDLHMPGMDGYELAARIRRGEGNHAHVALLAHSSELAHVTALKARKAGMNGFVGKPCSQLSLWQAMQQAWRQQQDQDRTPALAGRTVVLADDNDWNRRAVSAYLRQAGVTVVEAGHGAAVLDLLRQGQACDAVLLDLHMPGMNGWQTAQALRGSSLAGGRRLPIIALTARSDAAAAEAAAAAGMDGLITKPVDPARLFDELQRLLAGGPPVAPVAREPWAEYRVAPVRQEALLDLARLENYKRLGLLDELVDEGLPELERLVAHLPAALRAGDTGACVDTLHTLLGMSGEVGAAALYQEVRRLYIPIVEHGRWPSEGWEPALGALAQRTLAAMHDYRRAAASAPTH